MGHGSPVRSRALCWIAAAPQCSNPVCTPTGIDILEIRVAVNTAVAGGVREGVGDGP